MLLFSKGSTTSTAVLAGGTIPPRDAAISRAQAAGATVKMPATDMFWGDRYGVVIDPFGHTWAFATHKSDPNPEEIAEGAKAAFAQA